MAARGRCDASEAHDRACDGCADDTDGTPVEAGPLAGHEVSGDAEKISPEQLGNLEPVAWSEDDSRSDGGFDESIAHEFVPNEWGAESCRVCGLPYAQWMGYPCPEKAELISFWIRRRKL